MIFSDLLCCFSFGRRGNKSSLSTGAEEFKSSCVFCNPTPDKFRIILQTSQFVVFVDRSPAAFYHLLAIPRAHIPNVKSLEGEIGAKIVQDLQKVGHEALNLLSRTNDMKSQANELRFGFHIPPFRSVDHLHLHCLALPFRSSLKALKYRIAPGDPESRPPTFKGLGWFVTSDQAISILRSGKQISVSPS